jgi:hypothetical protein
VTLRGFGAWASSIHCRFTAGVQLIAAGAYSIPAKDDDIACCLKRLRHVSRLAELLETVRIAFLVYPFAGFRISRLRSPSQMWLTMSVSGRPGRSKSLKIEVTAVVKRRTSNRLRKSELARTQARQSGNPKG